ncbi:MAG: SCP2 sterol-binding domain-containing protein [Gammaproteobacteria bacterium]|nr:SCP2 sterol-binding domain-containing protein [Gammaproteobacteria bacterium]
MKAFSIGTLLAPLVELALNNALSGSNAAQQDLKQLQDKLIAMELREFPLKLYFHAIDGRLQVLGEQQGTPDMTIRAASFALLEAAIKRNEAPPRGIELNGDAETAQIFSRLLKRADLDWEELLSHYTGDVIAHQVGNLARSLNRWGRDVTARAGQDLAEYLVYESEVLPPRLEVEIFLDAVDQLRNDVDRLAARLQHISADTGHA